uniref:NADH-ubiquinone oxidoreductase chain 3 n=1 Tax=Paratimomenus flavocapitatus TaxID=2021295 RepID=A0A678PAH5_9NEOP|nr:NADH dehydrogenase subunit 3 [Paratimomenus flavocapitatus]
MFLSSWMGVGLLILASLMMGLASSLGKKLSGPEKNSPFECGFDPQGSARLPFSLRFFLIAVLFLVFDVEIILLLPLVKTLSGDPLSWALGGAGVMSILLGGLSFEWHQGALNWTL